MTVLSYQDAKYLFKQSLQYGLCQDKLEERVEFLKFCDQLEREGDTITYIPNDVISGALDDGYL